MVAAIVRGVGAGVIWAFVLGLIALRGGPFAAGPGVAGFAALGLLAGTIVAPAHLLERWARRDPTLLRRTSAGAAVLTLTLGVLIVAWANVIYLDRFLATGSVGQALGEANASAAAFVGAPGQAVGAFAPIATAVTATILLRVAGVGVIAQTVLAAMLTAVVWIFFGALARPDLASVRVALTACTPLSLTLPILLHQGDLLLGPAAVTEGDDAKTEADAEAA